MSTGLKWLSCLLLLSAMLAGCNSAAPAPEPAVAPATAAPVQAAPAATEVPTTAEGEAPAAAAPAAAGAAVFFSTQFEPVEEQEKFRAILQEGEFDFTGTSEGPLLDILQASAQAGKSEIDVIGALHGTFPPLASKDALANMIDVADDLGADREFVPAYLETGLLGSEDFLYYVPWMQATYIMAANKEALPYLPEGADVTTLTWEQLGEWCKNIVDQTGSPRCGLPHAGLFHRFLEGYMWPSWTGGMVTQFKSEDAAAMLTWMKESLWPYVHPQSISYEFMQEPLQSDEVWVAFDHTARLKDALNATPDKFITFPAPSGTYGLGFMPVIAGLGIPANAPNPDAGAAVIEYLTRPEIQAKVLKELGFFPIVAGAETTDVPPGIAMEAATVAAQSAAANALPALLPVGLGERGGEINQIFRNAFDRVVLNGEDVRTVLDEEGANLQKLMDETGAPCWAPDASSEGPCQVQ